MGKEEERVERRIRSKEREERDNVGGIEMKARG